MPLNLAKLVNDILDSVVLYVYAHLSAIWIVARHPIRGPRYLAYKNLRNIDHTVSPRAFLFINLFVCFYFVEFASPLIFVFWKASFTGPAFQEALKQLRASQVDFVPMIVRSLVVFTTIYAVLDIATSLSERHPRRRSLVRNSLLFAFGLQPLAVIGAFLYVTRFDLFDSKRGTFIVITALGLLALVAWLAVVCAIKTLRPRGAPPARIVAGVVAFGFVALVYAQAVGLALWDPFPKETTLAVRQVSCGWMPSGDVVVEAFLDNVATSRKLIPLQTDSGSRDVTVWADDILIDGGVLESSAGPNAPYLVLRPGEFGWIRFKGALPSVKIPRNCNVTLQQDKASGNAVWH